MLASKYVLVCSETNIAAGNSHDAVEKKHIAKALIVLEPTAKPLGRTGIVAAIAAAAHVRFGTQRMKARSVRASRTQAARRQREHAAFMGGAGPLDRRPGDAEVPGCQPSPIERALAAMVMRQSKYATHRARQKLDQNSCGASDQMGAMGAVP